MIYYTSPYRIDKNIGKYYNDFMSIIPNDDDWVCFTDGDTLFLTPDYGNLIQAVTENNPKYGVFTCFTNRIGNPKQNVAQAGYLPQSDDIAEHRVIATQIEQKYGNQVEDFDSFKAHAYGDSKMSGMLMLIKKSVWDKCKFIDGALGVDNAFHESIRNEGIKVGLIKGLYIYHWYRGGNSKQTSHLK